MTHLRYDLMTATLQCKETRHAEIVMKDLGIIYQQATPQSIADQWWFWNCRNLPKHLPEYLTILKVNPMECIGYGLSKETAEKIRDFEE